MFWITRREYNEGRSDLVSSSEVTALRREVWRLNEELRLIKEHLGVTIHRRTPDLILECTGGPERGE